ncbi:MAG: hypothetical protein N4A49_05525 [Marinifilaceae bacterium]|jgi:hypothetical protein|nr:hypothetical protein [Marinifilaceae bacterium]
MIHNDCFEINSSLSIIRQRLISYFKNKGFSLVKNKEYSLHFSKSNFLNNMLFNDPDKWSCFVSVDIHKNTSLSYKLYLSYKLNSGLNFNKRFLATYISNRINNLINFIKFYRKADLPKNSQIIKLSSCTQFTSLVLGNVTGIVVLYNAFNIYGFFIPSYIAIAVFIFTNFVSFSIVQFVFVQLHINRKI